VSNLEEEKACSTIIKQPIVDGYLRNDSKKRLLKEARKIKLAQALYLIKKCQVPVKAAAKRLRINYARLRWIVKDGIDDPEVAFRRKQHRDRF
jgi:hypothetical protein